MKKTLNAFIKQSPRLKKSETFVDNNPQARSNPYEPEMSIREAVEVSTTEYEFTHGKPRGSAGGWMFGKHKSVNFDKHKEGEDYVTIKGVHTYGEAKKKAKTWAAEKGHRLIHVLPESVEFQEGAVDLTLKTAKNVAAAGAGGYTAKTVDDYGGQLGKELVKNASGQIAASTTAQAVANRASAKLAAKAALSKASASAGGRAPGIIPKALSAGSKTAGIASKGIGLVGFGLGKLAWPVAAGVAAYDAYKGYNAQPYATFGRKVTNAGQNALSGFTLGAVPPPKGLQEGWANLVLQGAKKATPIVTKVLANLEKRVAAKAAAKETPKLPTPTNSVKAAPKVTPKFEPEVARRAGTTRSSMPLTPRASQPAKVAAPSKPVAAASKPAGSRTERIKAAIKQHGPQIGAQVATQSALDVAAPNFYTPPGQDASYAPKGVDPVNAGIGIAGALAANKNKAAWKSGSKWGLGVGAAMQGVSAIRAWDKMSGSEYKAADAAARGQQPK